MSDTSLRGMTFRIRHTMLPVGDLDRTIDFYTRLLGMDLMRLRDQPEQKLRTAILGYGSEDESLALEMVQAGAVSVPRPVPRWAGHVAL